jgi:hypothetical protein
MVVGWDPVDEIWRIKCDSPWHSLRDPDPLESLLVGGSELPPPMVLNDLWANSPPATSKAEERVAELTALYEQEEDSSVVAGKDLDALFDKCLPPLDEEDNDETDT